MSDLKGGPFAMSAMQQWEAVKRNRIKRLSRGTLTQTHLFSVPPPPVATAWTIYWRWNIAKRTKGMSFPDVEEFLRYVGENKWQKHHAWYNLQPWLTAMDCLDAQRSTYPMKEFDLFPVKWTDLKEPVIL